MVAGRGAVGGMRGGGEKLVLVVGAAGTLGNMGWVCVDVLMVMEVESGVAVALGGGAAAMDDWGGRGRHVVREGPLAELFFCDVRARRHIRQSGEGVLARVVVDIRSVDVVAGAGGLRLTGFLPHWLGRPPALEDESELMVQDTHQRDLSREEVSKMRDGGCFFASMSQSTCSTHRSILKPFLPETHIHSLSSIQKPKLTLLIINIYLRLTNTHIIYTKHTDLYS